MSALGAQLEQLGVEIDAQLFELALTHRSFAYENGGIPTNERLEFLGDAVLQIIVTDHLYRRFPDLPEGRLAKLRAAVVSAVGLAEVARVLGLGGLLKLGRGETAAGGADKTSVLADATEAMIGAIYLSGGMEAAAKFVHHNIDHRIEQAEMLGSGLDPKTALQELCVARQLPQPVYRIAESGPDHSKWFRASVLVDGDELGAGEGSSKKQAEQFAARIAAERLAKDA